MSICVQTKHRSIFPLQIYANREDDQPVSRRPAGVRKTNATEWLIIDNYFRYMEINFERAHDGACCSPTRLTYDLICKCGCALCVPWLWITWCLFEHWPSLRCPIFIAKTTRKLTPFDSARVEELCRLRAMNPPPICSAFSMRRTGWWWKVYI